MKKVPALLLTVLMLMCTLTAVDAAVTSTESAQSTERGKIDLYLFRSGTGSEKVGDNDLKVGLGDTVSVDIFIRNPDREKVSGLEFYLTVPDSCFSIVSQGKNLNGTFKPFIQGSFFTQVQGTVLPHGNTCLDTLKATMNGVPGWQLNYIEITGPDIGFGRPVSQLRYGVGATFKLVALAPCDSATIRLDFDQYAARESRYLITDDSDSYSFRTYNTAYITVTGLKIDPPIPDLIMEPDATDSSIDLDRHVGLSSIPDSLLIWTSRGNDRVTVSIDPKTHVATFETPAGFRGVENVIFTVDTGRNVTASDTMRVIVDAPPTILDDMVPDPIVIHEDSLESVLELAAIVSDPDDDFDDLTFHFTTGGNVTADSAAGMLTLLGAPNFNGDDTLRIAVYDTYGLGDSVTVAIDVLPVNDPPTLSDLPDVTFQRRETKLLTITDYAADIDGDELTTTCSAMYLTGTMNGSSLVIGGKEGFIGTDTMTVTVTDPSGLTASGIMLVTITPAKKKPVWTPLPKLGFAQNQADSSLVLWDYVADPDDPDTTLTFQVTNLDNVDQWSINPRNGRLYLRDLDDTPGYDLLTVTAADVGGNMASASLRVFICPADGTPIVKGIPDTTIVAGTQSVWIDLDDYYYDLDDSDEDMTWTWGRQAGADSSATITISPLTRQIRVTSIGPDIVGLDKIFFTATDPGGKFDDDICTVSVIEDIYKPTVDLPAKIGFVAGTKAVLDVDDYVSDPEYDRSELTWGWFGNIKSVIAFEEPDGLDTRPVSFSGASTWRGWERVGFTASNPMGGSDSDTLTVFSVPDDGSPVAGGLTHLTLKAGTCIYVDLGDCYWDADTPEYGMTWSATGQDSLTITIDQPLHLAHICALSDTWEGDETVTFTVMDSDRHTSSMQVVITVTDAVMRNTFSAMIFRNPMQEDYMDLYIRSTRTLARTPTAYVKAGPDSTGVTLRTLDSQFYHGSYLLPLDISLGVQGVGELVVRGETTDAHTVQDTARFAYGRIAAKGGKLALDGFTLDIPGGALDGSALITVTTGVASHDLDAAKQTDGEILFDDTVYTVGPTSLNPARPFSVGFDHGGHPEGAAVFRLTSEGWRFVGACGDGAEQAPALSRTGTFRFGRDTAPPMLRLLDDRDGMIRILGIDNGTGIDVGSLSVTVDGLPVTCRWRPESSVMLVDGSELTGGDAALLAVTAADRTGNTTTSVFTVDTGAEPAAIALEQNSPNPFNPVTHISFTIPVEDRVTVEVYDMLGRKVRVLADERFTPGRHTLTWDARDDRGDTVGTGVYIYRVISGDTSLSRKMMLVR